MPLAGWFIARFRVGRATLVGTLMLSLSPAIISMANTFSFLIVAMVYFGLTNALMDVSMNAAAALTEKKLQRHIMSTCHGMWSFGAMVGSAVGSITVGLGIGIRPHLFIAVILVISSVIVLSRLISSYEEERKTGEKVFALPNLALFGLATAAFCIMLSEGAIADWSAIYMKETLLSNPFLIGLAYSSFSFLMAIGRFSGDAVIPTIGKRHTVFWGALLSGIGLGATLIIGDPMFAIIGFGLTGFGYSCIIPVLFSSAANEPGFSSGTGIASVSIIGYTGFLAGPPVIGFLADSYGMTLALGYVAILSFLVCVIALLIKFK